MASRGLYAILTGVADGMNQELEKRDQRNRQDQLMQRQRQQTLDDRATARSQQLTDTAAANKREDTLIKGQRDYADVVRDIEYKREQANDYKQHIRSMKRDLKLHDWDKEATEKKQEFILEMKQFDGELQLLFTELDSLYEEKRNLRDTRQAKAVRTEVAERADTRRQEIWDHDDAVLEKGYKREDTLINRARGYELKMRELGIDREDEVWEREQKALINRIWLEREWKLSDIANAFEHADADREDTQEHEKAMRKEGYREGEKSQKRGFKHDEKMQKSQHKQARSMLELSQAYGMDMNEMNFGQEVFMAGERFKQDMAVAGAKAQSAPGSPQKMSSYKSASQYAKSLKGSGLMSTLRDEVSSLGTTDEDGDFDPLFDIQNEFKELDMAAVDRVIMPHLTSATSRLMSDPGWNTLSSDEQEYQLRQSAYESYISETAKKIIQRVGDLPVEVTVDQINAGLMQIDEDNFVYNPGAEPTMDAMVQKMLMRDDMDLKDIELLLTSLIDAVAPGSRKEQQAGGKTGILNFLTKKR